MAGLIVLAIFIALFYFAGPLVILGVMLGFVALPFVLVAYASYRLVWQRFERKIHLWQERRSMRKRIKAMLRRNLNYLS